MTALNSIRPIRFYDLLPFELHNRILLDYPLDLLLSRGCHLIPYENGLFRDMTRLHDEVLKVLGWAYEVIDETEQSLRWDYLRTLRETVEIDLRHPSGKTTSLSPYGSVSQVSEYSKALRTALLGPETGSPRWKATEFGAIRFPSDLSRRVPDDSELVPAGTTGNILIRGRPGTCKSTLALQFAAACTSPPNHCMCLFICLEEAPDRVLAKCKEMHWKNFSALQRVTNIDASSSSEEIGRVLDGILRGQSKEKTPGEPGVLLPMLTPRGLRPTAQSAEGTFQTRYEQLERLLRGFRWLRENTVSHKNYPLPDLRMVCLDSLSALAERPLTREELYRVFDLFTNYGVVGVVTTEDEASDGANTMEYLADVVIDLRAEHDAGYEVRYLEIRKSRHQHQVYGLHPFVVRNFKSARVAPQPRVTEKSTITSQGGLFQAVMVYPSIHHNVGALRKEKGANELGDFSLGMKALNDMLPHGLKRPSVVTITGPRGTYKSHIARDFLLDGVASQESVLLIHFGGSQQFRPSEWKKGCKHCGGDKHEPSAWFMNKKLGERFGDTKKANAPKCQCQRHRWQHISEGTKENIGLGSWNTAKLVRKAWRFDNFQDKKGKTPVLIELDFGPGALLPEQFIKFVRDIFRELGEHPKQTAARIRRVVLDDVSLIGTSYPFLRNSKTSGDLFLSALTHVARYHDCDCVLVGTLGEYGEADDVVKRACTLADSVLACDICDVFGARFITVTGEGLMVGRKRDSANPNRFEYGEFVPGVIVPGENGRFEVHPDLLEGLVGFEQRQVHRPGLVVSVFSEGPILKKYNAELRTVLERSFASPKSGDTPEALRRADGIVSVLEFDSGISGPLHESLGILHGKPIDKTVVCALDEFYAHSIHVSKRTPEEVLCAIRIPENESESFRRERHQLGLGEDFAVPYYSNVLLLAYNSDYFEKIGFPLDVPEQTAQKVKSWTALLNAVSSRRTKGDVIDCGTWSQETLACVLLDILIQNVKISSSRRYNIRQLVQFDSATRRKVIQELNSLRLLFRRSSRFKTWQSQQYPPQASERLSKSLRSKNPRSSQEKGVNANATKTGPHSVPITETDEKGIGSEKQRLVPDAPIYVCWYTQLRELLLERPNLGSKLRVAALPGGGIRGDWYLGVVKGSVSVKLGESIINILTSHDEDNRRFIEGVGLPVHTYGIRSGQKRSGRKAWPRGNVDLNDVIAIHANARKRSGIDAYLRARATLSAVCEQIIFSSEEDSKQEPIEDLLGRLSAIIESECVQDVSV